MTTLQRNWQDVFSLVSQQYRTSCPAKIRYAMWIIISFLLVTFSACSLSLTSSLRTSSEISTARQAQRHISPTADPQQVMMGKVQQLLAGMTLEQKLGQLIMVEYLGNKYEDSDLQYMVMKQYVGGVLYQSVNHNFDVPYNTVDSLAAFSRQLQQDAKIPLLISTDQEGGQVNRLEIFHGPLPSAASMAATANPTYIYQQGEQDAKWLQQLGMNSDLAPVVDVHTVDPPILQDRMFGDTSQAVTTYAGAFLDGLQQNHVAGCLKHFPGLGALTSDPHTGLPTIHRSLSELQRIDLAPYQAMLSKNHPAMIMDTDVLIPAIDPTLPAELSPKTVNGLLRDQLGYDGVVITDGLYMQGISDHWTLSQAATLAIIAGNDLVEGPYTVSQVASVLSAFKQALQDGNLSQAQIDRSVERILLMKVEYGIIK